MKRFLGRRCAPNIEPVKDYLCLESPNAGVLYISGDRSSMTYLQYSKDGKTWNNISRGSGTISILISAGDKLYFRGEGTALNNASLTGTIFGRKRTEDTNGPFKVSGNIMSLLYGDDFEDKTVVGAYAFAELFERIRISDISELKLPATTVGNYAYYNMFSGVEAYEVAPSYSYYYNQKTFTIAPELPATVLGAHCYDKMFYYTSLEEMPELPAITLAESCYDTMFAKTNIRELKPLPATVLSRLCYCNMFTACSNITHLPHNLLPATALAEGCYELMLHSCSSLEVIPQDLLPASVMAPECYMGMFYNCTNLNYIPSKLLANATTLAEECFQQMFCQCSKLTYVPQGFLPATALAEYCYAQMFSNCISLEDIPSNLLPATILAPHCYLQMFSGCSNLENIPVNLLPGTTLADHCYGGMFNNCDGLTTVPKGLLDSATTMSQYSCSGMFYGCSSLTTIPAEFLPATTLASYCYQSMFEDCDALTTIGSPLIPENAVYASYCCEYMFKNCDALQTVPLDLLPSPNTAQRCYQQMFYDCTRLKNTPAFNFTTTTDSCCSYMFAKCIRLTTIEQLPAETLADYAYEYMFSECSSLTTVDDDLILAKNAGEGSMQFMFQKCTYLTKTPALRLETTTDRTGRWCCHAMFLNCTSLLNTCELKPTLLGSGAYFRMFEGCTSLVNDGDTSIVGDIKATNYEEGGCTRMFYGCTSLTTAPNMTINGNIGPQTFSSMFEGCASLTDIYNIRFNGNSAAYEAYKAMFKNCTALKKLPSEQNNRQRTITLSITRLNAGSITPYSRCEEMFYNCTSLEDISNLSLPSNNADSKDYKSMFEGCEKLDNVPENIIGATIFGEYACQAMFKGCKSLGTAPYIKEFSTTGGWSFVSMFEDCYTEHTETTTDPVTGEQTTAATYTGLTRMAALDGVHSSIKPINNSEQERGIVNHHACMSMFKNCKALTELPYIYPINTNVHVNSGGYFFANMFDGCDSIVELSENIFKADLFDGYITYHDLGKQWAYQMFANCKNLKRVTCSLLSNMTLTNGCYAGMFMNCEELEIVPTDLLPKTVSREVGYTDVIPLACYKEMFKGCSALTQAPNLPATKFAQITDSTSYSSSQSYYGMFENCEALVIAPNISYFTNSNRIDCIFPGEYMFKGCKALKDNVPILSGRIQGYNMFNGCEALESIELNIDNDPYSNFYNRLSLYCMFQGCTALTDVNGSIKIALDRNNYAGLMFDGCVELKNGPQLNISGSKTRTSWEDNCQKMFNDCAKLVSVTGTITCNNPVSDSYSGPYKDMFKGCVKLRQAPAITLSGTINGICENLFNSCTDLGLPLDETQPNPQDTPVYLTVNNGKIGSNAFKNMFRKCTNLKRVIGTITVTEFNGGSGFALMFGECTALEDIPTFIINTDTVRAYTYSEMFYNCKALKKIPKSLFTGISTINEHCYTHMFDGCSALGTLPQSGSIDDYILKENDLPAKTLVSNCYSYMFHGTAITEVEDGAIQATKAAQGCFYHMFSSSTLRVFGKNNIPKTKTTEVLPSSCYEGMFAECSNLDLRDKQGNIDEDLVNNLLPAINLGFACYRDMFRGCTSLTKAPKLPAKTPQTYCYQEMFRGCTNLAKIICLLETNPGNVTTNWVYGVAANGTFYKKRGVTWPIGASGIPSGWTVIEVD